ncbi:MAG TPA: cell division protein FtsZ [Cyclobacteriaceae bacterium]
MADNTYQFDLPTHQKSIIKVIGVGGGGSNAVNHMCRLGIKDVEFVVCNTDLQALESSPVKNKLQIGINLTGGLGAGANPEKGKNAAVESKEEIKQLLDDGTKMVFITAGMGGGTGTGAAPIIAEIARDMDILTVGIVTAPFGFEGRKKRTQAEQGLAELKQHCDTVLVILNDKLREIYGNQSIRDAFSKADNILTTAAKGIAEIITVPGYVNVDFEDVKTVMKNSGAAVMGSSLTSGDNRALKAAEEAINSPLLNNQNILGADKILLSIISGEEAELQMDELTEITDYMQDAAGEDAEVIFGHGVDTNLGDELRVTIIATGFEENGQLNIPQKAKNEKKVFDLESNKQIPLFKNESKPKPNEDDKSKDEQRVFTFDFNDDNKNGSDDINENLSVHEPKRESEEDAPLEELEGMAHPPSKKVQLMEQARERVRRIKELKNNPEFDANAFKEKLEVPAYERKKVKLRDVPHSSERSISRFNLTDDNNILGDNRFLHDNVD